MNIGVTATGKGLDSTVFDKFGQTPFLLIVNMDTQDCTVIPHQPEPGSDRALARLVLEHRCEAVITGSVDEGAFDILADDGVTRYAATGMVVEEALEAMEKRALPFIRNPQGSDQCMGNHHR